MTTVDWVALAFVAVAAFVGWRKGLLASALSVAGLVAGAIIGARLAPHLLHGGSRSPYTPVAALAGAAFGAIVFEALAGFVGVRLRSGLRVPPLRTLDSLGGLALGAAAGLVLVWVAGTVAAHLPGQTELRREAQRSLVVRRLTELAPPARVLRALARVDPLPAIAGPIAPVAPPDPGIAREPFVRRAERSVVKISGTACGVGVEGSGWVVRPGLVVTAAHVVAGQQEPEVETFDGRDSDATVVAFDPRNDVAVLRADGLSAPRLALVDPTPGTAVAILGYPGDGPFHATPGRIGRTVRVLSEDAYGHGPVTRTITTVRGLVRHGNSGGPAVDSRGRVQTTVFAARVGSKSGFGVPADAVRDALRGTAGPVSTGSCAGD